MRGAALTHGPARVADCEIYVAAESQKGIVIGKGGKALKAVGSKARMRMEAFFDKQATRTSPSTLRGTVGPWGVGGRRALSAHGRLRVQVHLETRVKVSKSWRDNEAALTGFGYLGD